jgi:hypothetical protein
MSQSLTAPLRAGALDGMSVDGLSWTESVALSLAVRPRKAVLVIAKLERLPHAAQCGQGPIS